MLEDNINKETECTTKDSIANWQNNLCQANTKVPEALVSNKTTK